VINQVITVDRKRFATGLFWQPVIGNVLPRAYAHQLAKNLNKKYGLYAEYKTMIGLGSTKDGVRFGMSSAAAEIANDLQEYVSFLCAFKTDKGFYIVASRNGIIIYDYLFDAESIARKEFDKLYSIPEWSAILAPSSWEIPRSKEKALASLIKQKTDTKLHQISILKSGLFSVVLISLFTLLLIYLFKAPIAEMLLPKRNIEQESPELVAEYKRQIEEKNKELDAKFEIAKPKPLVLPYDYLPDRTERAKLCYKSAGFVMQPISGWNQTSLKCGEKEISVTFKRDYGTLNDFYLTAGELMPGAVVQEISDDEILLKANLPELPVYSSQDERDADTVVRDITTVFQLINADYEISTVSDLITNGVDSTNVTVVEISVYSKLIPLEFMQIFNDYEGVYMTSVSWDVRSRTWKYEIIIYTK